MDAICGGEVDVLVEWIDAAAADTARMIAGMKAALEARQKAWLLTELPSELGKCSHAWVNLETLHRP